MDEAGSPQGGRKFIRVFTKGSVGVGDKCKLQRLERQGEDLVWWELRGKNKQDKGDSVGSLSWS